MTASTFRRRLALVGTALTLLMSPAVSAAAGFDFPANFRTQEVATNGTTLHVRIGGTGPAVVLLHGYGDTGDMWAPLAADLARTHTVIVPDLRGMGLSARAESGFEKAKRLKTSSASWMPCRRLAPTSWPTTSGTWSPTHSQRGILTG
jgi:pimeloyl-ACP methyl ester carboxylesterase